MEDIYIGIGSNVGNRRHNLDQAEFQLLGLMDIKSKSKIYETEPQYVRDQPKFLNAVFRGYTKLEPLPMLEELKKLEVSLGRREGPRNGPRLIDLDILYFGERQISTDTLTIPHPRIHERYFVLRPLLDVGPSLYHPVSGKSVQQLMNELPVGAEKGIIRVL